MKRKYDFDKISSETGFNPVQIEKVCRISDILENISQVRFMRNRLSLYGGTALAFMHFDAIERLSVDIDFNYRHIDEEDWGEIRDRIDSNIKTVLYALGYSDSEIRINSTHPLNRFTVKYRNHLGRPDEIKIETGYLRRIPILKEDKEYDFYHVGSHNRFKILTPIREELFGNKWCTMLYRGSSRDLFDVYRISKSVFDMDVFRRAAVFDSLMRGYPRLFDIDYREMIQGIRFDSSLLNMLFGGNVFDEKLVHEKVIGFTSSVLNNLSYEEKVLIETFFDELRLDDSIVSKIGGINDDIAYHPSILWQIKQLSRE